MTNPILETNIEGICETHVPTELKLIHEKILYYLDAIAILEEREDRLYKVAEALDITIEDYRVELRPLSRNSIKPVPNSLIFADRDNAYIGEIVDATTATFRDGSN